MVSPIRDISAAIVLAPIIAETKSGQHLRNEEVMKSMIESYSLYRLMTKCRKLREYAGNYRDDVKAFEFERLMRRKLLISSSVQSKDISGKNSVSVSTQSKPQSQNRGHGKAANLSAPELAWPRSKAIGCSIAHQRPGHAEQ